MTRTSLRSIFTGHATIRTFGTGAFEREYPCLQTSISQPTCKPDEDRRISPSLPDIRRKPRKVSKVREPRCGRHAMATFWRLAGLWSGTAAGSCDVEEEGTSFMVDDLYSSTAHPMHFHRSVTVAGRLAYADVLCPEKTRQTIRKMFRKPRGTGELSLIRGCTLSGSGH